MVGSCRIEHCARLWLGFFGTDQQRSGAGEEEPVARAQRGFCTSTSTIRHSASHLPEYLAQPNHKAA